MSAPGTLRVFIADAPAAWREYLLELRSDITGPEITEFANQRREATASIGQFNPAPRLLEKSRSHAKGLEARPSKNPDSRRLINVEAMNSPSPPYHRRALESGADSFQNRTVNFDPVRFLLVHFGRINRPAVIN